MRRLTVEGAGLGGDAQFVKVNARARYYQTLSEELDIVGLLTAGGGVINDFSEDGGRTFDLFKSSDRIIRGFEYNGIGPFDAHDRRAAWRQPVSARQRRDPVPAACHAGEPRAARRGIRRRSDLVRQRYRAFRASP